MNAPNFKIVERGEDLLIIQDLGPWDLFPTVTNRAEQVVRMLRDRGELPEGRTLLYYDSEGVLDEIVHSNGKFVKFRHHPGGRRSPA